MSVSEMRDRSCVEQPGLRFASSGLRQLPTSGVARLTRLLRVVISTHAVTRLPACLGGPHEQMVPVSLSFPCTRFGQRSDNAANDDIVGDQRLHQRCDCNEFCRRQRRCAGFFMHGGDSQGSL
jgi:hypothetical protein